jgi:beta-lactamase superfamily II metal-dependent hydrolase
MTLNIHMYSAGNADALALKFPDETWAVIDCGLNDGRPFVNYLRSQGCEDLAFVLLTHPDADHYLGLLEVFASFQRIDEFWMPEEYSVGKIALVELLNDHVYPRFKSKTLIPHYTYPGRTIYQLNTHKLKVTALSPFDEARWMAHRRIDRAMLSRKRINPANRISIVLFIRYNETNVILGADAEIVTWRKIISEPPEGIPSDWKAHVFKIPHHGSVDSWDKATMASILQKEGTIALISSSGNRSTMPNRDVLCGLTDLQALTYCTGRSVHCTPGRDPGMDCCGHIVVTISEENSISVAAQDTWRKVGVGYCDIQHRKASGVQC